MHLDCLGQRIRIGSKTLWGSYKSNAGFGNGIHTVISESLHRVRIENDETGHRSTVDPKCLVVVDLNLAGLAAKAAAAA
jgi:hypothetical protein